MTAVLAVGLATAVVYRNRDQGKYEMIAGVILSFICVYALQLILMAGPK